MEAALRVGCHVIFLDFCKDFDSLPPNILAVNLETYAFDGRIIRWTRNWMDGCIQCCCQQLQAYEFYELKIMRKHCRIRAEEWTL